jgi:hypothetical protein
MMRLPGGGDAVFNTFGTSLNCDLGRIHLLALFLSVILAIHGSDKLVILSDGD